VEAICDEVGTFEKQYCGGETRFDVLRKDHPVMDLEGKTIKKP